MIVQYYIDITIQPQNAQFPYLRQVATKVTTIRSTCILMNFSLTIIYGSGFLMTNFFLRFALFRALCGRHDLSPSLADPK